METNDDTRPTPRRREDDCGKACFRSEDAAKRSMRAMDTWKRDERWKGRTHAYFCRTCRAWHVGHL